MFFNRLLKKKNFTIINSIKIQTCINTNKLVIIIKLYQKKKIIFKIKSIE